MKNKKNLIILALFWGLWSFLFTLVPTSQGKSQWPESISGENGFYNLGEAIKKEPGFPLRGSDVEKARFVMSRLPEIAKKYGLDAGSGGKMSDIYIGVYRKFGSDPEGADSMKGLLGWGNCGEWTYAFQQVLSGAGVQSKPVFADKEGGTGHSGGFAGTDTTLYVEERTPGGAISRRVFDAFRAAYHGDSSQPNRKSVEDWKDVPLTDNDRLPRDGTRSSWQNMIGGHKPFIKDAGNEMEIPPQQPVDVQEKNLRDRRQKREEDRKKAEEEKKRREEEEARKKAEEEQKNKEAEQKAALQKALKEAGDLISSANAAIGRAQAAISAAKGAAATGKGVEPTIVSAQNAVQQARGTVLAVQSVCAKIVGEPVINASTERAKAASSAVEPLYQEVMETAGQTCQTVTKAQQSSNPDARRIFTTTAKALEERTKSKAASAQATIRRAREEANQAAVQSSNRSTAINQCETAETALSTADIRINAEGERINQAEAAVSAGPGQLDAAKEAIGQAESNKAGALGILSPFASEPEAQKMIAIANGIKPPSLEGIDKEIESGRVIVQNARAAVVQARAQIDTWKGLLTCCGDLSPTDNLVQEAGSAANAAEIFLSKIQAAVGRASGCIANLPGEGSSTAVYNPLDDPNLQKGDKPVDVAQVEQLGSKFQEGLGGKKPPDQKGEPTVIQQPEGYTSTGKPPGEGGDKPPTGPYPPPPPPGSETDPGKTASDYIKGLPPPKDPGTKGPPGKTTTPPGKPSPPPGATTTGIDIQVVGTAPPGKCNIVEGQLVPVEKWPVKIAGMTITLSGPVNQSTKSSGGGTFSFKEIPAGDYLITVKEWDYGMTKQNFTAPSGKSIKIVLKGSCPFLYVWTGEGFEKENDIYSTARLTLSDLASAQEDQNLRVASLENLTIRPVSLNNIPEELRREKTYRDRYRITRPLNADAQGMYRLKIREQAEEHSFTDFVQLIGVDHKPGQRVAAGRDGRVFLYESLNSVPLFFKGAEWPEDRPIGLYDREQTEAVLPGEAFSEGLLAVTWQGFRDGSGEGRSSSVGRPRLMLERKNPQGEWEATDWIYPRDEAETAFLVIEDRGPGWDSGKKVRLTATSCHPEKYHRIDRIGWARQAGEPPHLKNLPLVSAIKSGSEDVLATLLAPDGNSMHLKPEEEVLLSFEGAPLEKNLDRTFIFVSEGFYIPLPYIRIVASPSALQIGQD